jgi:hypothetical protein
MENKIVCFRRHSNGRTALVTSQPDGRYHASAATNNGTVLSVAFRQDIETIEEARRSADGFAHTDCTGAGCDSW